MTKNKKMKNPEKSSKMPKIRHLRNREK